MNEQSLKKLLKQVQQGKLDPEEALHRLKTLPFEDLEFACLDHHRALRSGVPEVIYCEGKSPEQIITIMRSMVKAGANILATRVNPETYKKLRRRLPPKTVYDVVSGTLVVRRRKTRKTAGSIIVVTAGTSDIPVAAEAAVTAEVFGSRVESIYDIGVAGIHRLLDKVERLRKARVIVVVAGMDGALASVVGGLVEKPVIAVPTSVGYGASFKGIAPLLTMLNSCAAGIATVNIDNGFGAGCLAHKINLLGEAEGNE